MLKKTSVFLEQNSVANGQQKSRASSGVEGPRSGIEPRGEAGACYCSWEAGLMGSDQMGHIADQNSSDTVAPHS